MSTASNAPYKTGDVVHLNSGSPPMTVMHQEGYGAGVALYKLKDEIPCVWMDEQGRPHQMSFAAACLRP